MSKTLRAQADCMARRAAGDRPLSRSLQACLPAETGPRGSSWRRLGVSRAAAPCGLHASLSPLDRRSGDRAHDAHRTALVSPFVAKPGVCVRRVKVLAASNVRKAWRVLMAPLRSRKADCGQAACARRGQQVAGEAAAPRRLGLAVVHQLHPRTPFDPRAEPRPAVTASPRERTAQALGAFPESPPQPARASPVGGRVQWDEQGRGTGPGPAARRREQWLPRGHRSRQEQRPVSGRKAGRPREGGLSPHLCRPRAPGENRGST